MSIALLIIDMQKEFYESEKYKNSLEDALEYINETANLFRKFDKPVIIIQDEEAGQGPGTKGYEVIDDLMTKDSDHWISKVYSNAFWKTDLEKLLNDLDVEFVVVSGFAAEYCVLFTYNGAWERDFKASMLQNGIVGNDPQMVKEAYAIRSFISIDALEFILKKLDQ